MKQLLIIGTGGHCKACIDVVETLEEYEIEGLITKKKTKALDFMGYPVVGTDSDLANILNPQKKVIIGLGQIKDYKTRLSLFNLIKKYEGELPVIISPRAYLSANSKVDEGSILMHDSFVNAYVSIGKNCIINSKALVEHDTRIGNDCHIAPGAIINGGVSIGEKSFIGSGTVINEGVEIGNKVVIGSGLKIKKNIPSGEIIKS